MTVADVFNDMSVLDNENDYTPGGTDEARGILAINTAIRFLYTVAAGYRKVLSKMGDNTVDTITQQEFTPKPAELMRIDSVWAIDTATKLPKYEIKPIEETGGHLPTVPWPFSWTTVLTNGQPWQYYGDEQYFYWRPIPDAVYKQRVYGLWLPNPVGDRTDSIELPGRGASILMLPIATFATKYLTMALDDPIDVLNALAQEVFGPALKTLQHGDFSRAKPRVYAFNHTT